MLLPIMAIIYKPKLSPSKPINTSKCNHYMCLSTGKQLPAFNFLGKNLLAAIKLCKPHDACWDGDSQLNNTIYYIPYIFSNSLSQKRPPHHISSSGHNICQMLPSSDSPYITTKCFQVRLTEMQADLKLYSQMLSHVLSED